MHGCGWKNNQAMDSWRSSRRHGLEDVEESGIQIPCLSPPSVYTMTDGVNELCLDVHEHRATAPET